MYKTETYEGSKKEDPPAHTPKYKIFLHRKRIVVKSGRIDRRTQSAFWYPMEKAFRGEDKAFQKPKNDFPWGMNNMFAPSVRW